MQEGLSYLLSSNVEQVSDFAAQFTVWVGVQTHISPYINAEQWESLHFVLVTAVSVTGGSFEF